MTRILDTDKKNHPSVYDGPYKSKGPCRRGVDLWYWTEWQTGSSKWVVYLRGNSLDHPLDSEMYFLHTVRCYWPDLLLSFEGTLDFLYILKGFTSPPTTNIIFITKHTLFVVLVFKTQSPLNGVPFFLV